MYPQLSQWATYAPSASRQCARCAAPQERTGQCTQLYRHHPNLVTSTGSILGNLTAIGTEYESFPRGPHAEVGIIRPNERPTTTAGYAHRCPMAPLENNGWPTSKHSIINWTWPLTNKVISGFHRSHDQDH